MPDNLQLHALQILKERGSSLWARISRAKRAAGDKAGSSLLSHPIVSFCLGFYSDYPKSHLFSPLSPSSLPSAHTNTRHYQILMLQLATFLFPSVTTTITQEFLSCS